MPKSYRQWSPDQPLLLPPDPRTWLPEGHLAHFVLEVVERLNISAIDDALAALLVQIVQISRCAGLAKLGHVSFDGSKVQANASKHKAMSYGRMVEEEKRLRAEIEALLARGEQQDEVEDARLGEGVAETDIPAEIHRREVRLARIESASNACGRPPVRFPRKSAPILDSWRRRMPCGATSSRWTPTSPLSGNAGLPCR